MEKKKDYLLLYVTLIGVVAVFGWMFLRPQPVVYFGEIASIIEDDAGTRFTFVPAQSPYPERDVALTEAKTGLVGEKGIQLQIRSAPDGTKLSQINLEEMFRKLRVGDQIAFFYQDADETVLKAIIFTTPNQ